MLWKYTHSLGLSAFDVCDCRCCAWAGEAGIAPGLDAALSIDLP